MSSQVAGLHNPASVRCPHLPSGAVWPHSQLQRNTHSVSLTRFKGKLLWPGKWFSWVAVTIHETTSSLLFSSYKKSLFEISALLKLISREHHIRIRSVFLITTVDTMDIFGLTGLRLFCYVLSLHIITQTLSISSWYWISCVLFGSLNIVQYWCLAASDFSCLCNLSMYVCWWFPLLSSSILLPLQLMLFFKIDLHIFVCWINCQIFYLKYLSFCSGLSCFAHESCCWLNILLTSFLSPGCAYLV